MALNLCQFCIACEAPEGLIRSCHMSRHNNFDCIRLIAALMVVFGHSFALLGLRDPVQWFTAGYDSIAGCGVAIFFVISGYLVAASVSRRSTASFLTARILRIVPALTIVTCFDILVVGPGFTELPWRDYFCTPSRWRMPKTRPYSV